MGKFHGYAGKLLRVDLSNKQITEQEFDEATARKYIGGSGLGAKYLYDEVPAGVEWSDEANRLIIASGPLGGTRVGGSGTVSVVTKGPLTNGAAATQANGFFGAFLRFSGYDGVIIQGKAKNWVYLYIHEGKAEIRDASHLLGKDTYETVDLIKSELGKRGAEMSVVSIGPAGENLVKFAAVFAEKGHVAGHNGTGAVMGSKKLKAIAVERKGAVPALKDREGLAAIAKQFQDNIVNDPRSLTGSYTYGTLNLLTTNIAGATGHVPVKNFATNNFDTTPEKLEKFGGPYIRSHFEPKPDPCWACFMHHCHHLTLTEGPYKGSVVEEPEYEGLAAFGPLIGIDDASVAIYLSDYCDRLGMENNEASWTLAMAIECYEKKLITIEDTGGLELKWGNYEAAKEMLLRIATRKGFGDILAEGGMRAAQRIGGEAPNIPIHSMKGNSPRVIDHRHRWPWLFDTTLGQGGGDEGYTMARPSDLGLKATPSLGGPNASEEDIINWNVNFKGPLPFEDSLGTCRFITRTDVLLLVKAVNAATGWDLTPQEAMTTGKRIINLMRAFNIRHGHTAEMDRPSPRYGSTPVDGPTQGKTILANWDELRRKYYEQIGWDAEMGKPLPDTLRQLGLEYTIPELWGK